MWDKVLGHTQIKEFLVSYLARTERPHALLFTGPEGVGKRMLALEFARSLLCFHHSPKDGCEACRLMNIEDGNLSHPDFLHVAREEDPKTHRLKDLSIDQMRDLVSKAAFAPVMSDTKVCIIEDIDRMTEPAANSFLKLLEEPPAGWVFILLAASTDRLLTTILSRVVQLRFHGIPLELEVKALQAYFVANEAKAPDLEQLEVLARLSEGSLGLALEYRQREVFAYREQAYAFIEGLPLSSPLSFLVGRVWLEKYERQEALLFVQLLQLLLRDMLTYRLDLKASLYNSDLATNLEVLSRKWQVKGLKRALGAVDEAYRALVANVAVKLTMEAMALKIDKFCKEG